MQPNHFAVPPDKQKLLADLHLLLLKGKTWRYLRYLHLRDFVSRIVDQIETVCVCGAGHGLAELAIAIEFPHLKMALTDISGNGYPRYQRAQRICEQFDIKQLTFSIWNACEPAKERFDFVCSTEVLEHIDEARLAAENMRAAARSYIYCLVPYADDETNANPARRRRAFEKHEHFVCGYDAKSIEGLFPNPVAIAGTYWPAHGLLWRKRMEHMTPDEIEASQNELRELAVGDVIDCVPQKGGDAAGIKILSRL